MINPQKHQWHSPIPVLIGASNHESSGGVGAPSHESSGGSSGAPWCVCSQKSGGVRA